MREQKLPEYDLLDHPEDEPITLIGRPEALQGEMRFRNPGTEKLVLRDAQVRSELLRAALPGAPGPAAHVLRRIVLRPGQVRLVPLNMALNPHTPPGEYHGEVEVAGHSRTVVMHVTEVVQLDISPSQIVVENHPSEKVLKRVVFSNGGNVPLTIGEIGPVVLDEELRECRTLRAAVEEAGDHLTGLDDFLAALGRQYKRVLEATGLMRVHNTAGAFVLEPGQAHPADLEIRVPEKLEKHTRYFGSAALYTSNLDFVIVPAHAGQSQRPRARAGR